MILATIRQYDGVRAYPSEITLKFDKFHQMASVLQGIAASALQRPGDAIIISVEEPEDTEEEEG